jgi:hypothetical protein
MIDERELATRLKSAGESMPLRELRYEKVLPRARSASRRLVALVTVVLIAAVATAVVVTPSFWDEESSILEGPTAPPHPSTLTLEEVRPVLQTFARGMSGEAAPQTWHLLTPRAKEIIGGRAQWQQQLKRQKYLFAWIYRSDRLLYLTPLPGDRAVIVAAQPEPRDGMWLLTAVAVQEIGGRVLIDLDTRPRVSLVPESPVFEAAAACVPGSDDCADPAEQMPTVSPGDTFSVLLQPAEGVEAVRFSLGGDAWVAEAELNPAGDGVRASVEFNGGEVPSGQTVFVVSIMKSDGTVDAYGYRVLVSD